MPRLYARQIGETARRLLAPGARGQVLAGFSRAAYLVTEQADLVWLAAESAPRHPRGLRIAGPFPRLAAGQAFYVGGEGIDVAPDLQVDFGAALTWAAPSISRHAVLGIDRVPSRVRSIFSTGLDLSPARGLGRLIPKTLALAAGQLECEPEVDPVLALAWPGVCAIARASLSHDMPALLREANALLGLGEGLTPSGDDFLGGLLFGIHAIQRLYPGSIHWGSAELASFVEAARQRTHPISFTLLRDAANGQAVEPLHEFIRAVLSDRPPASAGQIASCLTQIGHSTGWDLLAGALTGLLWTFRSPDPIA